MKIFFIDFENVHNDGLLGVDMLTEDDEVVIFYSANADSISFEMLHKFMFCKAKLNYYKVRRGGKNALDFQLASFLGYKLLINPDAEFFIISKDNGFDSVIDFWSYGYVEVKPSIRRFNSIKTILTWLTSQAALNATEKINAIKAVEKMISEKNNKLTENNAVIINESTDVSVAETSDNSVAETTEVIKTITDEAKPENVSKTETVKSEAVKNETPSIKAIEIKPEKPKPKPRQTIKKTPLVKVKTEDKSKTETEIQIPIEITENDLTIINDLMTKVKSTHELYISAVKQFGQKKGVEVYTASKGQYLAMQKTNKEAGLATQKVIKETGKEISS